MKRKPSAGQQFLRVEWPTVLLVAVCYTLWLSAIFWLYEINAVLALMVMAIAVALHSSLQHEALHGHPTGNASVNEALVFLPLGLAYPYRRFKALHIKHHNDERLTDPYDDPESFYRAAFEYEELPDALKTLLRLNNTLIGRMIMGPAFMIAGFICADLKKIKDGNRDVLEAWLLHAVGVVLVAGILAAAGIPIWLYAIAAAYFGLSLITIRTYAEHQWSERPDGRTIIVENSPLALLFLNNNLHLVHHKHPTVAWYNLPALYRARRDDWQAMNGGYVFRNYWALFRAFAFRAKEPVEHPVLRKQRQTGRMLQPQSMVSGVEAIPVPAEAQKK